jgi:hypothetical protein
MTKLVEPSPAPPLIESDGLPLRFGDVDRLDLVFAAILAFAVVLLASILIVAAPIGDHLFPSGGFHFFPSVMHLIYRKPAEQTRYLLAIAFVLALGLALILARAPRTLMATSAGRSGIRIASIFCQISVVGVAVWGWWAQFHYTDGEPPTTHFSNGNLVAACLIAGGVLMLVRMRPGLLDERPFVARSLRSWMWLALAALITICWLLPSFFREQNLSAASLSVTYHLQFTFDDFVAVVDGRTPLVNYAEQYASLLPFAVWPAFRVAGAQVGTFTAMMCLFSLVSLLSIERVFALVFRSERLALVLYVPFLATSLFFILRSGSQLFSWASYYAVFPMRYAGPYVLLWLCVRHLRGLRPGKPVVVFAFAGLVVLNNIEFGLPAYLALVIAMLVSEKPDMARLASLIKDAAIGLVSAMAIVAVLTLAVVGKLPDLALLTLYSRVFGEGGFGLLHTPIAGLYLIVDMTLAAAVIVAAVRCRLGAGDGAYTAALAYSGVFGLGAGNYYMGRTHPGGLVVLFSVWALSVILLGLLALRTVATSRARPKASALLPVVSVSILLGLVATAVAQFPAPWTQLRRITTMEPAPQPYNISAAVAFVRSTTVPGEPIVLLAPLGHLIALDAKVKNVSMYSSQEDIVTYEQLDEELAALRDAGGTRFYVVAGTFPEVDEKLVSDRFSPTVNAASGITEWRR